MIGSSPSHNATSPLERTDGSKLTTMEPPNATPLTVTSFPASNKQPGTGEAIPGFRVEPLTSTGSSASREREQGDVYGPRLSWMTGLWSWELEKLGTRVGAKRRLINS